MSGEYEETYFATLQPACYKQPIAANEHVGSTTTALLLQKEMRFLFEHAVQLPTAGRLAYRGVSLSEYGFFKKKKKRKAPGVEVVVGSPR